ncbi:MAG: hypothetical protein KDD62_10930, partial [Bdellovibrionales bacterium]|nr:hypothetical protein [Bdellovibrionales bacterium]
SAAFGFNFEGRVNPNTVVSRVETLVAAIQAEGQSVREISLADTMGWGTPEKVRATIAEVQTKFPDIDISLHLHDTRGMGIANAYAGLMEGVDIFESSIAGVGGCPFVKGAAGNVCTEDLVYLMHELGVVTGIDLDILVEVAWMVPEFLGLDAHGKLARVQSKI